MGGTVTTRAIDENEVKCEDSKSDVPEDNRRMFGGDASYSISRRSR